MRLRLPLLLLAVLGVSAAPAVGQRRLSLEGRDLTAASKIARDVLQRGTYLLLDRDTTLPATFVAPGDVVVYDAEVRLEGTIRGDVAVLGGHLFLRPGSAVTGKIAVVGGGVYTSTKGTHGDIVEADPSTRVVERGPGALAGAPGVPADTSGADLEIVRAGDPTRFTFLPEPSPTYDRVNGLTAAIGARFLPTPYRTGPRVEAWGAYHVGRGTWGGGVRGDTPLGIADYRFEAGVSRATRTNDDWAMGDLMNSLAVVLVGRDYRDYYESERVEARVHRPIARPLIAGESWLAPYAGFLASRDRSLQAQDETWTLGDEGGLRRPNPAIDSGTVVSVTAGTELFFVMKTSRLRADLSAERGIPGPGDFEFTQALFQGTYEGTAIRLHEFRIRARAMGPLGHGGSPRQRWGILGGAATLPTLAIGELRGDRLIFLESAYAVPIPGVRLPYIGAPLLEATHATGTAWRTGTRMPAWTQNVGLRVRFPFVNAGFVVDPARRPVRPRLTFGVGLPGG